MPRVGVPGVPDDLRAVGLTGFAAGAVEDHRPTVDVDVDPRGGAGPQPLVPDKREGLRLGTVTGAAARYHLVATRAERHCGFEGRAGGPDRRIEIRPVHAEHHVGAVVAA